MEQKKGRAIALLPIGVFLVLYLGLGIVFEYVMKIEMGFYNIPIVVAFLAAILVGCLQNRSVSFDALLAAIHKVFKGNRGGQLGMGLLVGAMDIATANNTVAIVMAGPIAKQMSGEYGISSQKAASILDTFGCVFQGILPYGAQMLYALSAAVVMGHTVTAFQVIPYLFYPYCLLVSSLFFMFFVPEKRQK